MKYHTVSRLIIIISTLSVLSLGLTGCASLQYESKIEEVRLVADKIAGYTLPADYREQFAVELKDYQVVSMIGTEDSSHIYLVQAPAGSDIQMDTIQQETMILEADSHADLHQMHTVEIRPVTIRGQAASLYIQEGLNSENQPYRSVTALFEGRNGPAVVSISSLVSVWNAAMVDSFLASLN